MKVLSLFDGISAGQLALQRAGIEVSKYYACEIDKYAIQITQKNFPETIQLGDVTQVTAEDVGSIDLLIGGSPCQAFSQAGDRLGFDDPRGQLFFQYVRLLRELKPKWFLLENVKMKPEHEAVITEYLGVEPIEINSALVSAQNRKRLYWTNIPLERLPEDLGLRLRDVLQDPSEIEDKYYLTDKAVTYMTSKGLDRWKRHPNYVDGKSGTLTANMHKGVPYGCIKIAEVDLKGHDLMRRVYSEEGKAPTLNTCNGGNREPKVITPGATVARRLTPVECERLQTFPDNYTDCVSMTRRYHALGNSWTVDVVAHIFRGLK
jgi:DNA-cytosine methyltransferase